MARLCSAKRRTVCLGVLLLSILQMLVYFMSTRHIGNVHMQSGIHSTRYGDHLLLRNGTLSIAIYGRLGNQMFGYASILGLAYTMNFSNIVIDGGGDLLSSFQLSNNMVSFSPIPLNAKHVEEMRCCAFDERLTMFSNKEDINVVGYLLSWKYFYNIEKHIRKEFTFVTSILSKAKQIKLDIASMFNDTSLFKNRTYIGVHIRRGDFLLESKIKFGHYPVSKDYIIHAIQLCTKMFGEDIIFVFCSDDIRWVKRNFSNFTDKWKMAFVEDNPAAVDMAVLSLCDHTIVTTGSYGWWAAWLAGGKTIISKQQARNGSYLSTQFAYPDYFYPDWIIIE
ncbi:galactoside 2-alpha-L-fucosyltransferase SEC1-like [Dreissena polymorpha]|uniref:L-Fucosyltransferase n=1 Tax=Dreissena polymorpha TaxID=45954 RepID=A0A9D4KCQ5_DREPO|nr:galactoside 2-alpha-L-fucosyltransferase SEC1-like [Dreissena polymorpha]KAH3836831.1 hypothetical protein DPMN_110207 [Dreissena polymorpha]